MSEAEDLRRQLEAAYASIQELDDDLAAGRIGSEDHADLKQRSERQAATLHTRLTEAERLEAEAPVRPPAPASASRLGARLRTPLALTVGGVLVLVFGVVLGVLVTRFTADERGTAPGGVAMGARAVSGVPQEQPPVSHALETLRQEVETETAPTPKLLAFAHLALDEGQIPASIWAYKRVLARDKKNVEAITHIALILAQGNHLDEALARLDEALRIDPKYAHAQWDRAHILFQQKQDYAGAIEALEAFLKLVPSGTDADQARSLLADARKRAETAGKSGDGRAKPRG